MIFILGGRNCKLHSRGGDRVGESTWSRELLPGGEQTAGWWEKTAVCTQTPGQASWESVGSHSLGGPRPHLSLSWGQGACGKSVYSPTAPPAVAGLISEADSLGTGSRFSSVESSSFKVQLKCHLLCKDSPNPRGKINHPSSVFPQLSVDTFRIVLSHRTRIYVFTSLPLQLTETSRGQVPCHSVSLHLGQQCACSGCSINE